MKKITLIFLSFIVLSFYGCAEVLNELKKFDFNLPLANTEIVNALKESLIIGSEAATEQLGSKNGYYNDKILKIMLPEESVIITDNIAKIPGGSRLVEDVIAGINRSAEDAASEAAPIFLQTIKKMSISDAFAILNGADNAATQYFRDNSFDQLFNLYQPKINESLDKKLIGLYSTNELWNKLTGEWNLVAHTYIGKIAGFKPIDIKLHDYLTNKALSGLFEKIEIEESSIRRDPAARVTPLLRRVFGSLDKKQ